MTPERTPLIEVEFHLPFEVTANAGLRSAF